MNKKVILGIGIGLIALVLVAAIVVLVSVMGANTNGKNDPTVPAVYKEGDIVKIPIEITENPGMIIAKTVVNYDASVLDYVECEKGIFTDNTVSAKDGVATCLLMTDITVDSKDITEKGTAATLVFKVKKGAKAGDYLFSVDEKTSEYANLKEKFVSPKVSVTNKITIK